MNRGAGYRLKIPCKYHFYGPVRHRVYVLWNSGYGQSPRGIQYFLCLSCCFSATAKNQMLKTELQILSTYGMISSPWCWLGVFQSHLKTKLPTADCFSVRLCYSPGSSKSETQKWGYLRVCLCVVHLTACGFKAWHNPIWTLTSLHTRQLSLLYKCLYYHAPRHQCFSAWAVQGLVDLI